jgi:YesN/AraC family two-component response regulator
MPVMSGIEVIQKLKELNPNILQELRIIIVSGGLS